MDNSSSLHSKKNIIDNKTQHENLDQQDQQELQTRTKIENVKTLSTKTINAAQK